jgi:nickel transport protein
VTIGRFAAGFIPAAALAVAWTSDAQAHALSHSSHNEGGAVVLSMSYTDGSVPRFSSIRVFSPADPKQPFQIGRSDDAGRFVFLPTTPGTWRVMFEDDGEDGHKADFTVEVASGQVSAAHLPGWQKWLLALSLIGNAALAHQLWQFSRSRRKTVARS